VLSVIGCLQIDGWDVAAVFVEAAVVVLMRVILSSAAVTTRCCRGG
jgi:hypothetical protein